MVDKLCCGLTLVFIHSFKCPFLKSLLFIVSPPWVSKQRKKEDKLFEVSVRMDIVLK